MFTVIAGMPHPPLKSCNSHTLLRPSDWEMDEYIGCYSMREKVGGFRTRAKKLPDVLIHISRRGYLDL
jgi:hypothetical protein